MLEERVFEILSRTLPEDHLDLQLARGNLASTLAALGDLAGARLLEEQALESRLRTLPEDHPELQRARSDVALLLAVMGEAAVCRQLARDLAITTRRKGRSLASISEKQLASEGVIGTVLSISSGAGAFAPDLTGERLAFSMVEAVRGATATAARLGRSLQGDAEGQAMQVALARGSRELNELAGSREANTARFTNLARERDRLHRKLLGRLEDNDVGGLLPDLEAKAIAERLAPGEAGIAYWRYDRWQIDLETSESSTIPSYLAWVLRPDGFFGRIELGSVEAVEKAINDWRKAIGAPTRGVTKSRPLSGAVQAKGRRVRQLIFDPVRDALGSSDRIWIAAAQALHLIPLSALPDEVGVIGDRLEIVHLQSLSHLTLNAPASLSEPSVLAMGGIRYDGEAESLRPQDSPLAGSRGASCSALSGGSGESYTWKFGRLPGTRGEAEVVGEYFLDVFEDTGAPEPLVLTRSKASRDAFESLAPKHRYVHLATHGWFAPESVVSTADGRVIDDKMSLVASSLRDQVIGLAPSLLCGLAFAGANGEADMYGRVRGVMTAEELSAMDLTGVELCVLSACETNVGLRRGGQGIASLQTALHAAGVQTAITSLWKVPDEATRELMTEFYRRLWVLKEPKGKALWNAKQKLREQLDGEGKSVYSVRDWAGWVLSGDPD